MAVADDLGRVADLCSAGAKRSLAAMLALGPKPEASPAALLWEQQTMRLQGQINSLTALNAKLTAASVLAGMDALSGELATIGEVAVDAQAKIRQIAAVSELLTKMAKVLDLGLAILAASAAPLPLTIGAVVTAGEALADAF